MHAVAHRPIGALAAPAAALKALCLDARWPSSSILQLVFPHTSGLSFKAVLPIHRSFIQGSQCDSPEPHCGHSDCFPLCDRLSLEPLPSSGLPPSQQSADEALYTAHPPTKLRLDIKDVDCRGLCCSPPLRPAYLQ